MVYRVLLFEADGTRDTPRGNIVFHRLLVEREDDYCCIPEGLLTREQILELSGYLRHLPPIGCGRIGNYRWVEAEA